MTGETRESDSSRNQVQEELNANEAESVGQSQTPAAAGAPEIQMSLDLVVVQWLQLPP